MIRGFESQPCVFDDKAGASKTKEQHWVKGICSNHLGIHKSVLEISVLKILKSKSFQFSCQKKPTLDATNNNKQPFTRGKDTVNSYFV